MERLAVFLFSSFVIEPWSAENNSETHQLAELKIKTRIWIKFHTAVTQDHKKITAALQLQTALKYITRILHGVQAKISQYNFRASISTFCIFVILRWEVTFTFDGFFIG